MKKVVLAFMAVLCLSGTILAAGGARPCLASCCLDPRLGYMINEGTDQAQTLDWIDLFLTAGLARSFAWGMGENGGKGLLASCFLSPRAGRDLDKYDIRTREWIALVLPIVHIATALESYRGETWSKIVEKENLAK